MGWPLGIFYTLKNVAAIISWISIKEKKGEKKSSDGRKHLRRNTEELTLRMTEPPTGQLTPS